MSRRIAGASLALALLLVIVFLLTRAPGTTKDTREAGAEPVASLELEVGFPEAFSYLASVRELSTGEVLVADPVGEVVVRADLLAGTADTLGRVGSGPREYRGPDRIFPLPGDSALLVDLGNGRLTVLTPEGDFVDWIPMALSTPEGRTLSLQPGFVDGAGKLYARSIRLGLTAPPNSTPLARYSREGREEAPWASRIP